MKICLTVDLEPDCPPWLMTWRGVDEGLGPLLELLERHQVEATFFTTGRLAENRPQAIRELVGRGHELGGHGHTHRKLTDLSPADWEEEIKASTRALRAFAPVTSFRAPYLRLPAEAAPVLARLGYRRDSSTAAYKPWFRPARPPQDLISIPVSATSSVLRLPAAIRDFWLGRLKSPVVVLFVHPWEFVDLTREKIRWDCRFRTGTAALDCLSGVLDFFQKRGGRFLRLDQI